MSNKSLFYHKANKVRTNLLLFIDKELQMQKKISQKNKNYFAYKKPIIEQSFFQVIEEEIISNDVVNNNEQDLQTKSYKKQATVVNIPSKFESVKLFNDRQITKIKSPHKIYPQSSRKININGKLLTTKSNHFDIKIRNKKYYMKTFHQRDSAICFEKKFEHAKNFDYYKKYLLKLAKSFKKIK